MDGGATYSGVHHGRCPGTQLALPGGSAQPGEGTRDQSMTNLSTNSPLDQDLTLDLCPICQHPLSAHDRIGVRWCAATQLGVGQRECMCIVAVGSTSSTGASWAQIRHGAAAR